MLSLFISHFVADFLFQTDKMAINKSKSLIWLSYHSVVYALAFLITSCITVMLSVIFPFLLGHVILLPIGFYIVNGILHFMVDYGTSKWTSHLWAKEDRHGFFCVIGGDQCLHMIILYLTAVFFLG
jgi:hypothetical protein